MRVSKGKDGIFRVEGLAGLAALCPGDAVRIRVHVARVEALPFHWSPVDERYLRPVGRAREQASAVSEWCMGEDFVEVALPERIAGQGDEERWFLTFLCLEVGVRGDSGRWRRLGAACEGLVIGASMGAEAVVEGDGEEELLAERKVDVCSAVGGASGNADGVFRDGDSGTGGALIPLCGETMRRANDFWVFGDVVALDGGKARFGRAGP